jgi:scyllo-inositol 2-dehydrogenase (NADP+)
MTSGAIGVALIGYGLAGEVFHAPLIGSIPAMELRTVVSSRADALAAAGLAQARDADAVLADPDVALVVVASPSATHHALARAALEAGKHVLVDKPLAMTSREARELIDLAAERGRALSLFHNRRWDGDFLTVQALIAEGRLGEVKLYEACWDRHRPSVGDHWKDEESQGGGVLFDLAPHLVDQALVLFGLPDRVSADIIRQRPGARADDLFDLRLHYGDRLVRLGASMLAPAPRARFQLHGTRASFVKHGLDPQQGQLKAGLRPEDAGYGDEPADQHGWLTETRGARTSVPTKQGRWQEVYLKLAEAIAGRGPIPVDPEEGWTGLRIIEAARRSAERGQIIDFRAFAFEAG